MKPQEAINVLEQYECFLKGLGSETGAQKMRDCGICLFGLALALREIRTALAIHQDRNDVEELVFDIANRALLDNSG